MTTKTDWHWSTRSSFASIKYSKKKIKRHRLTGKGSKNLISKLRTKGSGSTKVSNLKQHSTVKLKKQINGKQELQGSRKKLSEPRNYNCITTSWATNLT